MNLPFDIPMPLLLAGVALIGGGAGFLLKRLMTNAPKRERADYLNTVADLGAKLRSHGMTIDDVNALEAVIKSPILASSGGATPALHEMAVDNEPAVFHTTAAMRGRAGAEYEVVEAKLAQTLMDLRILVDEQEEGALDAAHIAWLKYREALESRALAEFGNGTGGPLAMMLAGIAETTRRTDELRAEVKDRASR